MKTTDVDGQMRFIIDTIRNVQEHFLTGRSRQARGLAGCEMSLGQIQMARLIQAHGAMTVTRLAALLKVSPPSASAMVNRLVEKGLLTRETDRADRRAVAVNLSRRAIKQMRTFERSMECHFGDLLEQLGPKTTRKWYEVMQDIQRVLGAANREEGSRHVGA